MERVLVTGSKGFIGQALCEKLRHIGCNVFELDEKESAGGEQSFHGDICDAPFVRKVLQHARPHTIFHLAARAGVNWCEENQEEAFRTNVSGTGVLVALCAEIPCCRHFVFASSSLVYGGSKLPFTEEARCDLTGLSSVYAKTKKLGEDLILGNSSCFDKVTICRLFSVYGPNARPDMAPFRFLTDVFEGNPVTIFGDGSARRDFTFVGDIVDAFCGTINRSGDRHEIYNFGHGRARSVLELLASVELCLGKKGILRKLASRPFDISVTECSNAKAKAHNLGSFQVPLEKGIEKMVQWFCDSTPHYVVALIATCSGRKELLKRALESVSIQTRRPDFTVVSFDLSNADEMIDVEDMVHHLNSKLWKMPLGTILNWRTRESASGAWNSGILRVVEAFCENVPPTRIFIAILDDDDEWLPEHVQTCFCPASDMSVTGIIRMEDESEPKKLSIPKHLNQSQFLVGNPHVQGSNLFLRLNVLLEAGMFDENLSSCTDRDLIIRVLDLHCKQSFFDRHTVLHHADTVRERLSTRGSKKKLNGLTEFWRKYQGRMTEDERVSFYERSKSMFGWSKPETEPEQAVISSRGTASLDEVIDDRTDHFVIGIVSDASKDIIHHLLEDIRALDWKYLDVFVLENGPVAATDGLLRETVMKARSSGLRCSIITLKDVFNLKGGLPEWILLEEARRLSISESRTIIQILCWAIARSMQKTFSLKQAPKVWILDDDKRISRDTFGEIRRLCASNSFPCIIGRDLDTPPLPSASMIRTQACDFYYNSFSWNQLDNSKSKSSIGLDYYYHDLAEGEWKHLECPVFQGNAANRDDFLSLMCEKFSKALSGLATFRVLVSSTPKNLQSDYRGGCTIVCELEMLKNVANLSPCFDGTFARRSDFVWAIVNRQRFGHACYIGENVFVRHSRHPDDAVTAEVLFKEVLTDIEGASVYRAVAAFFEGSCNWSATFSSFFSQRLVSLLANIHRVVGVARSVLLSVAHVDVEKVCFKALSLYCVKLWSDMILLALKNLPGLQYQFEQWMITNIIHLKPLVHGDNEGLVEQAGAGIFARHRISNSTIRLHRVFDNTKNYQYVGMGGEGVVFVHDGLAFKVLDGFSCRGGSVELLERFINRCGSCKVLNVPTAIFGLQDKNFLVTQSPFCKGMKLTWPLKTAELVGLFELVKECRSLKLIARNVSESNFVVTDDGLRFVDFGLDFQDWSEAEEEKMLRKLFLIATLRFRDDMAKLCRESMSNMYLPQLSCMRYFKEAMNAFFDRNDHCLFDFVLKFADCGSKGSLHVLDYGCGKGKFVSVVFSKFQDQLQRYVGFDVDASMQERIESRRNVEFIANRETVVRSKFDFVFCTRLFCCLQDDESVQTAISDICNCLKDISSRAFVLFCSSLGVGSTKDLPSGRKRKEFIRPDHWYLRMFGVANLEVVEHSFYISCQVPKLAPTAEYVLFCLRKRDVAERILPKCALVIRTCAMEHQSIYFRIVHIVTVLLSEQDSSAERVVLVDCAKVEDFVREYDSSNFDALLRTLDRLKDERYIDRIVMSSKNPGGIYQKWFGKSWSMPETHASDGTTIALGLETFDCVDCELILSVDSDVIFVRKDPNHSVFLEAQEIFARNPTCISWSINVTQERTIPVSVSSRYESRCSVMHKSRLLQKVPLLMGKPFEKGYHRIFEESGIFSARGGSSSIGFIHPQNSSKEDIVQYGLNVGIIENALRVPKSQIGKADLQFDPVEKSSLQDMCGLRSEDLIVVSCGKVDHSAFLKWFDSIQSQTLKGFGCVLIDDANDSYVRSFIRKKCTEAKFHISLIQPHVRRGSLANYVFAIRKLCDNPHSVICCVDTDDFLANEHVLERVQHVYEKGPLIGVAVGGMYRSDKANANYPITFTQSRHVRGGGNVWQHLKTFRKSLFDKIRDEDLRDSNGKYFCSASDWAFMLPIVEMAFRCYEFDFQTYIYNGRLLSKLERDIREENIQAIVSRPPYAKVCPLIAVCGDAQIRDSVIELQGICTSLGRKLAKVGYWVVTGGMGGVMEFVSRGAENRSVGLLPGHDRNEGNPFSTLSISTGTGHGRNAIVGNCDALVVLGGGSGTLSEASIAWSNRRLVIALVGTGGTADKIAGTKLDQRKRYDASEIPYDCVFAAQSVDHVIDILERNLAKYTKFFKINSVK